MLGTLHLNKFGCRLAARGQWKLVPSADVRRLGLLAVGSEVKHFSGMATAASTNE